MFLIRMFLIPYIVTLAVEMVVALLWGYRKGRDLLTVLWVNTVTNLSVTAIRYLGNQHLHTVEARTVLVIVLELAVLFSEWLLFRKFMSRCRHPFLFSLCMNAASYGAGLLIPVVMQAIVR